MARRAERGGGAGGARAGRAGGGRGRRRGARGQRRARAPRLEEEEPGPGGALPRFTGTRDPRPVPTPVGARRAPAAAQLTPGTGRRESPCAPRAPLPAPVPRPGAEPTRRLGLLPAAAHRDRRRPRGSWRGCGRWVLARSREAARLCGPRSPAPRSAFSPPNPPTPERGGCRGEVKRDRSRWRARALSTPLLSHQRIHAAQVQRILRGTRHQEVYLIS